MIIYDREKKEYYIEEEDKETILNFLYKNTIGRMLLKIVSHTYFSKLTALYYDSKLSCNRVKKFINKYNIDISTCNNKEFKTFSEFFERRQNEKIDKTKEHLISPAHGKIKAYKISDKLTVNIKDSLYKVEDIVKDKRLANKYKNGTLLIIRLSLSDFHNFSFIDDGVLVKQYEIPGELHTIRPISSKYKVYKRNKRTITVMNTDNFGEVVQVEVGAMLVGKIVNYNKQVFKKGEDKGYFAYGGSTIVLLLKNNVKIDKDILIQSAMTKESKVKLGDKIGELKEQ